MRLEFETDVVHGFKQGSGPSINPVRHGKMNFQIPNLEEFHLFISSKDI